MKIDWNLAVIIFSPIVALFIGAFLEKKLKEKPKLITYLSNTFAINAKNPDGSNLNVFTHSIVLQNLGRKTAENIRIQHNILPAFSIFPSVEYKQNDLPDGKKVIVIPRLVPKERIIINYLYFPPLIWKNINTSIKYNGGFAKKVEMRPTPKYSKWFERLSVFLCLIGIVSIIYLIIILIRWIVLFL